MKKKLLLPLFLFYSLSIIYAQPGSLNQAFGLNGIVKTSLGAGVGTFYNCMAVQSDGKIVVAGYTSNNNNYTAIGLARYNKDGSPDNSFSGDGKQITDPGAGTTAAFGSIAYSIAIQSDGKILVGGKTFNSSTSNTDFVLVRYKSDGSPDNTFSGDGIQTTNFGGVNNQVNAIAVQGDGKIVAAGYAEVTAGENYFSADFAIARYNADGSPDNNFSGDGKQVTTFYSPEIQADESINSIVIHDDGKITIAGSASFPVRNPDPGGPLATFAATLFRYNSNGTLDNSFSRYSIANFSYAKSLTTQSDNKLLLALGNPITSAFFEVIRFNVDGTVDNTFDGDGRVTTDFGSVANANSLAIQADGKIIAGGFINAGGVNNNFALVRYNSDGSIDNTFDVDGKQTTDAGGSEVINDIAIANNRLYVAGSGGYSSGSSGVVASYFLNNENQVASLNIVSPLNNATYLAPAVIPLVADAKNPNGAIKKVELYNGTSLLRTEYTSPYAWNWKNVPVGNYVITAKSYNADNSVVSSAQVHVSVIANKPPAITITDPINNQKFSAPASITLTAVAGDIDGTVTKVELYTGATLLRTEYGVPYSWKWEGVAVGNYTITSKAYDNKGGITTSEPVAISVAANKAPLVSIINPVNNQQIQGPANILLEAYASDVDGSVAKVELYNGTTLLRTEYYAPYSWNWKKVPAGSYTIKAKATDNLGKATTSLPVSITVTSPGEPVISSNHALLNNVASVSSAVSVTILPDPAKDILNIRTSGFEQNRKLIIAVVSVSGAVVNTICTNPNRIIQTDVSSLKPGVYFLKVLGGNKVSYSQFLKL